VSGKHAERREFWREKVTEHDESGQSVREFCTEQGLGEHSFYAWRQRLRKERAPGGFTLVDTKAAGITEREPMELVLATGDRLRIPVDAATLRVVLSVLREQ
jgi:transposase-like protein